MGKFRKIWRKLLIAMDPSAGILSEKAVEILVSKEKTKKLNEAIDLERENYLRAFEGKEPLPVDEDLSVERIGFGQY